MELITTGLRAFQLLFTIVVFSLSVSLARGQKYESLPILTGYLAAAGAIGLLASLTGTAALFVTSLSGIVMWTLDAVSGLLLLAGGIVGVIYTRKASCNDWTTLWDNYLFDGGKGPKYEDGSYRYGVRNDQLKGRCVSYKADIAFLFLGFAACAAVLGWTFISGGDTMKSRRRGNISR